MWKSGDGVNKNLYPPPPPPLPQLIRLLHEDITIMLLFIWDI